MDVKPPFVVEGRSLLAVTHLAWLGVKIQGPAFWGFNKRSEDSTHRLRWMESLPKTSSDRKKLLFLLPEVNLLYANIEDSHILCNLRLITKCILNNEQKRQLIWLPF